MNCGCGRGFGFRGSCPPAPYTGVGRGGLPRCHYPGLSRVSSPKEELDFLKSKAETTKRQLEDIERRIQELEKKD